MKMRDDADSETHNSSDDLRVEDLAVDPATSAADTMAPTTTTATPTLGNFVTSFTLPANELASAVELARSQLPQLLSECEFSEGNDDWRRIRGKRGSRVRLWEKGRVSAITATDAKPKIHRKSLPVPDDFHHRATISATAFSSGGDKDSYAVRSSITVRASLSAVMKALDSSTSTAYRSFTKIIYESLVTDTSVLSHATLATNTNSKQPVHLAEAVAVRWLACKCSSPLVSDCDLSLLEYTKVHTIDELLAAHSSNNNNNSDRDSIANGLRPSDKLPTAYKLLRSMETKHCPELSDLVRVTVPLGGFLLYETDHGDVTDVVCYLSAASPRKSKQSPRGHHSFLSSDDRQFRAIQLMLQQMALAIDRLGNAVDAYTMSLQLPSVRCTRWIENAERTECICCYRRFHPLTRRRHHCRMCGDVICRDCSVHKDADLPTVGPTTLRICKLCNAEHFSRSSILATIATDVKQRLPPVETSVSTAKQTRRQTLLTIDTAKQQSPKKPLDNQRLHRTRRHSIDPPLSCPKPSVPPVVSRQSQRVPALSPTKSTVSGKWSSAFYARQSTVSPSRLPHSPIPAFAQTQPLPRSVSKDIRYHHHAQSRFNFGLMKSGVLLSPQTRPRQHSTSDSLESPHGQWKTAPMGFAATMPVKSSSSMVASPKRPPKAAATTESNQTQEATDTKRTRLSLSHRAVCDPPTEYEDLLRELCQRSSEATAARFAAVSVFTSLEAGGNLVHYLKSTNSPKLMRIAANMLCCEPVLHALRPVATRNALAFQLDSIDFSTLPFVKGPQRARFYAGVPLVDSKMRVLGAVAVFDSRIEEDDSELLDATELLASIVRATMPRIEARQAKCQLEAFMKNPLLHSVDPQLVSRAEEEEEEDEDDDDGPVDWVDEEHVRTMPQQHRAAPSTLEFYKRQMHRLVQQAHQTQGQVMQNASAMNMHGVSY